jgi:predicted nucleotidyltransferase component of viral defense system
MKEKVIKNIPASIRQRLLALAQQRGDDFQDVVRRYGMERFLYRLSRSRYRHDFILKGATLFLVWTGEYYRPTKDLDLLFSGSSDLRRLEAIIREICVIPCEQDGVIFLDDSVKAERIKADQEYHGVRIKAAGRLDTVRIALQIDVGFGDAVVPAPDAMDFPSLLDAPVSHLEVYPRETMVAEKYQAMVELGMANSRMKDFYDLWVLAGNFTFDGALLAEAIKTTFQRRKTVLPDNEPLAFTPHFYLDKAKLSMWHAFLNKGDFKIKNESLEMVVRFIASFIMPPTGALVQNAVFKKRWVPDKEWR